MTGSVFIVHAVDTEGPLYEGLEGLFAEIEEAELVYSDIKSVADEFPDVKFHWSNTVEAFRAVLNLLKKKAPKINIDLNGERLIVTSTGGDVLGCPAVPRNAHP